MELGFGVPFPQHHRHPPEAPLVAPRLLRRRLLRPTLGSTWEARVMGTGPCA